jgi:putative endonuclease
MSESHDLGQKGEELAVEHLTKSGFRIVARNWKSGRNEVDIIAENRDHIIFAEVKTRAEDFYLDPTHAVNREKQRSIILCADTYIKRYNISKECRFDVIIIIKKGDSFQVDHIEDAFYPTLR